MDNDPASKIDPDGRSAKSTIVNEKEEVVGGSTTDRYLGVYRISRLTKENFDTKKLNTYKSTGAKIGATYPMNSFLEPTTNTCMGQINFNKSAKENILHATRIFGNYLLNRSGTEGFFHYKNNAGSTGVYDIKTWGFATETGKEWRESTDEERFKFIYQASFIGDYKIMTKRDERNFFAGRAMKMTGTPETVWLSGFGAYQSNGNSTGFLFYGKAGVNWLDQKFKVLV